MDLTTRKTLREALTKLSTEIAAALRPQLLAPGPVGERARALHREEKVGDAFDLWTDLLSRRAAVLWVLKSLYVRALEDRGLLRPGRILDGESEQLFAHLAPNLGPTAYLRWVFRDLATGTTGLPELFAPQPAELGTVPDALSRKLFDLWRSKDLDSGAVRYRFDDEHFDGRLLGDLYQDLDPVVKKRYALLQTPDFVLDFILDETLTPAIAEFGIETVRVLDPACGSGHFLLAAFKRLVAGMRAKHPEQPVRDVVQGALDRVVGIDLNDYACALARARLVMTALELCGETDLAAAHAFHPRVYCADALEQVEADEQVELTAIPPEHQASTGMLTPPETRAALREVLKPRFHAVVGNPPYITEKDKSKKAYHTSTQGKKRRYLAATMAYSLGAPFTERMLQLAVAGGFVGEITADSFIKREFGKALIRDVLATHDLQTVVSLAGAYIPQHGTATVLLFARNRAPTGPAVRVVMTKRGEAGKPADPARGKVWLSCVEGHGHPGFENEYVSVADVARATMARHPWSIGGGGAADLQHTLSSRSAVQLGTVVHLIGFGAVTREDEAYVVPARSGDRWLVQPDNVVAYIFGEAVRDWVAHSNLDVVFPYTPGGTAKPAALGGYLSKLWGLRTQLWLRQGKGFKTKRDSGGEYYEYSMFYPDRFAGTKIAFAFKATHNHFVLDRGGKVFNRTAPVIKLPAGATEAQHFVLLGQLNSSTGEFWTKQIMQSMGAQGVGRGIASEEWGHFFERDGTKLESFPLARTEDAELESFAARLDALARARVDDSPRAAIDAHATSGTAPLRAALDERRARDLDRLSRMVALQEELDWLCYRLYGIDPDAEVRAPDQLAPLTPGLRPFEVTLAREDAERRAALARGEEPDEQPTAWFERHGWTPHTTLDALPDSERAIVQARLDRTEASRELSLLEQPTYKRRWYKPDHDKEEREALTLWLQDRIEDWAKARKEPFTVTQVAAALRSDAGVLAVGELLTGRADFDVDALVAEQIADQAVPGLKTHVFKPEGLVKRRGWEETWDLQHREDAGTLPPGVTPPVPKKYDSKDYVRAEYWALRGKLDVPKERFIAFTEVPAEVSDEPLYGWAGWTHRERARVLLALDEKAEGAGVKVQERYGLLYGVWFLLPYVAWESAQAASDFRADVRSLVGKDGVTEAMLDEWARSHPPPGRGKAKKAATEKKPPKAKRGKATPEE